MAKASNPQDLVPLSFLMHILKSLQKILWVSMMKTCQMKILKDFGAIQPTGLTTSCQEKARMLSSIVLGTWSSTQARHRATDFCLCMEGSHSVMSWTFTSTPSMCLSEVDLLQLVLFTSHTNTRLPSLCMVEKTRMLCCILGHGHQELKSLLMLAWFLWLESQGHHSPDWCQKSAEAQQRFSLTLVSTGLPVIGQLSGQHPMAIQQKKPLFPHTTLPLVQSLCKAVFSIIIGVKHNPRLLIIMELI